MAQIIQFPQQRDPYPDIPTDARPPKPTRWPAHCWRWVAPTATRKGHWGVIPHEVKAYKARVRQEAESLAPDPTPVPPLLQPEDGEDEDDWLDNLCVAFYQEHGRLATDPEKAFLLAKGRWPLCEEEITRWERATRPDRTSLVLMAVVVLGGCILTLFT